MKSITAPVCLKNLLLPALVSLILSSTAMGADSMTLTTSSIRPSSNVILETTVKTSSTTGTRSNTTSNPADRWNGATFSLTQGYDISAISFTANSIYTNFSSASFELLLVDMTGVTVSYNQPVTFTSDKVIATYTISSATISQNYSSQVWLTFDIGGTTLTAGNYAFILTLPGDLARSLNTFPAADQSISSGFASTDKGLTYTGSGAPLAFTLQGTSSIPEPSTSVALFGLISFAVVVARRRHWRA
jgi:hypothetical protein